MSDKNFDYIQDTQTLVGQQRRELMDTKTGELMHVDQITKRVYGSKNFWKCYLMDFLTVLGIIDSKQVDVFIFIVENTNQANNTFLGTYKHISKEVGVSEPTIAKIMKKLQANNFIKRMQNGAWLVNPNILMKANTMEEHLESVKYRKKLMHVESVINSDPKLIDAYKTAEKRLAEQKPTRSLSRGMEPPTR
jgi:predicted transcriptional regulator